MGRLRAMTTHARAAGPLRIRALRAFHIATGPGEAVAALFEVAPAAAVGLEVRPTLTYNGDRHGDVGRRNARTRTPSLVEARQ